MKGLYLTYTTQTRSSPLRLRIKQFYFDGESCRKGHDKEAPKGRIFNLYCPCGSCNWTDNGRHISEYECDSCGQFVTVYGDY